MSRVQLQWALKLLLLLLLLFSAVALSQGSPDKISVDSRGQFVDGLGRVRIFHGVNSVLKQPPWYPDQMLNTSLLRAYQDWGFNAVRLGTMWAGVQPAANTVNATYLAVLGKIVTTLAAHDMYSIMDMHQDVLTSKYGSYDGVPRWLVDSFPPPPLPYPWPLPGPPSAWAEGYLTWAVSSAFQHLYRNESGALLHWANFWRSVAGIVRANDHLLGYELINEPWAGDVFGRPSLLLPGVAGRDNLLPVYDHLTQVLASEDPASIVFYEPVTWSLVVGGSGTGGTGFSRLPGGPANANRSALSYHYYCWIVSPSDESKYFPMWKQLACDDVLLTRNLENAKEAVEATGGGRFLTEFGICAPNGQANSTGTIECNEVLQRLDEQQQSWTYWDSNFTRADGGWNWEVVRSFARAYPMATAGQPVSYAFDLNSGRFDFAFQPDLGVRAPTVVFLPMSVHYPNGVSVNVTGGFTSRLDGNQLLVQPPTTGRRRGSVATVTVTVTKK